jgi:protein-glutamine gamma-glutamyltransferase
MEMRRSSHSATIPARESADPRAYRKMAAFLAGVSPVLVVLILTGAFAIFFLLPRTSSGYLGSYATGSEMSVGFTDRVRLGRIGQIQQSNAVVMHVEIEGDTRGTHDLKWRGIALGLFDGKVWSNTSEQMALSRSSGGQFFLPQMLDEPRRRTARPIHYRVLMEPIGTNVFFLAARPRSLHGAYRMIATDRAGAVYDLDLEHPPSVYEADSDLTVSSADELRAVTEASPPEIQLNYLQLPALDPRIPRLAQQITASASNDYDRASAIERYLMTSFGYTLQMSRTLPQDPLADFLFVRQRGHCEYFASSMAIMLRTLRIPSRVVNGFRTSEFNDLTGNYVVRASSAHSWVEAFFPGYGWISFDPTPAAPFSNATGWGRVLLYVDAAASFWREWVVDYDANHQHTLSEGTLQGTRSMVDHMRDWTQRRYAALLENARHTQQKLAKSPGRWSVLGIVLGVFLLLTANARVCLRWIRELRLKAHPEEAPSLAAALWYQRMIRWLARRGWKKSAVQTPEEFLTRIEDPAMRAHVEQFTRAYEAARFGESREQAKRLPELYEELTTANRR